MRPMQPLLASVATLLASVSPLHASVVLHDDFGDDVLDPAWEIVLLETDDWTYQEKLGHLWIYDIADATIDDGWSRVRLGQGVPPLDDFTVGFSIYWDSYGNPAAMQTLFIRLLDGSGDFVALAGAYDAWQSTSGTRFGQIGTLQTPIEHGSISHTEGASIELTRVSGSVEIRWNDSLLLSGSSAVPVQRVEIEASHSWRSNPTSTFGHVFIDGITVESGSTIGIPDGGREPATLGVVPSKPNPFERSVTTEFTLPGPGSVRVEVVDIRGHLVASIPGRSFTPGRHTVAWDGRGKDGRRARSGIYFLTLRWGGAQKSSKVLLMR